jgi:acetylcholinesterase
MLILFVTPALRQILESGSPGTIHALRAKDREVYWQNFVSGVSSCANLTTSSRTFDCLARANSTEMFLGVNTAIAKSPSGFGFAPTIDGYKGLLPAVPSWLLPWGHFARIPFIAGTNLDEGMIFLKDQLAVFIDLFKVPALPRPTWTLLPTLSAPVS